MTRAAYWLPLLYLCRGNHDASTHHDACSFFLIFMDRHSPFPFSEVIAGQARINDIRDLDIEDLLGRDTVRPDNAQVASSLFGRSVRTMRDEW
jgi:hypothetical protein